MFMRKLILLIGILLTGWVLYLLFSESFQSVPEPTPPTPNPQEEPEVVVEDPTKHVSEKGLEIFVDQPLPDTLISSPVMITGRAPGYWFFEASAPVVLTNWDGLIIAEGYIMAPEWMTAEYVPFSGTLTFMKPEYGEDGFLILKNDNPSGLPEQQDAIEFRVKFD